MEEKAKKTAEEKKNAQEMMKETEKLLDLAESSEVDLELEDVKTSFEEGKEELEQKNFRKSLDIFQEVIESIKSQSISKYEELIGPLDKILEEVDSESGSKEMQEKIENCKVLLEKGNIEEGLNEIVTVKKESEKIIEKGLIERKERLESLIDFLDEPEDVKEAGKELVSKAEYSLDSQEFERALSLIQDIEKEILDHVEEGLQENINEIERKKAKLEENKDIKLTNLDKLLNDGKSKIKEEKYLEALRDLKQGKKEINQIYDEKILGSKFRKLDEEIEEAEEIDAPIKTVEEMREEAENLEKKDKIEEADRLLNEALEKIEEKKFDKVLNTIAESREDFIKAKEIGADIKEPMRFLNTARDSLKKNDYKESLEWAHKGREKVQELTEKFEKTKEKIQEQKDEVRKLINVFEEDFEELEGLIEDIKYQWDEKNLEKVTSLSQELQEKIVKASKEKAKSLISDLEDLSKSAKKLDIDLESLSDQIKRSREKYEASDHLESAEIAQKGIEIISEKIESKLKQEYDEIREKQIEIEDIEKETKEELSDIVSKGEKSIEESRYDDSIKNLEHLRKKVKRVKMGAAESKIDEVLDKIELVEKEEIEVEDIDTQKEKIEKAKDFMKDDEETEALPLIEEAFDSLNNSLSLIAEKTLTTTREEIEEAKKEGVETDAYEENLKNLEEETERKNFVDSIISAKKLKKELVKLKDKRKEAYDMLSAAASKLKDLRKKKDGDELNSAKNILLEAKKEFEARNYENSIQKTQEADEILTNFEFDNLFEEVTHNIEEKLEKIENYELSDKEVKEFEEEFQEIKESVSDREKSDVKEIIKEKQTELNDILEKSLDEELEKIKDICDCAKEMGFQVDEKKDKIKRTRSLLNQKRITDSLEKLKGLKEDLDEIKEEGKSARKVLAEAKTTLMKAAIMGADVSKERKLSEKAEEDIEKARYHEAFEKAEKILDDSKKAQQDRLEQIINNSKKRIKDLSDKGVYTALAENKIQKAVKAKNERRFLEGVKFAMQTEGELERMGMQKKLANISLTKTKEELERLQDQGILIEQPKKILKQANQSYESGFYTKVIENSWKAWEELSNLLKAYEDIKLFIDNIDTLMEEFENREIDISEFEERKNEVIQYHRNGQYKKAKRILEDIDKILAENKDVIRDVIENLEGDVRKKGEKDVDNALEILKKARFFMEFDNPIEASKYIEEAKNISGLKKQKEYDEILNQVKESIKNAKKFGASVKSAVEKLEEAEAIKKEKDKIEAFEKIKEAHQEIEDVLSDYSPDIEVHVSGKFTVDKWDEADISLINQGQALAKDIKIELIGGEIRDISNKEKLKAGEEHVITCEIKPSNEGASIVASGLRIFDDKNFEDEEILDVSLGSELRVAEEKEKCEVCGEMIDEGEKLIYCSCGKLYDVSCSQEEEECPDCGTNLVVYEFQEEKEEKKAEKEKKKKKRLSLDF